MTNVVLVLTTLPADHADAAAFAGALIEEHLAACVNVLPVMTSIYRWKGTLEQNREQQLIIKTTADRIVALEAKIRAMHPYDLPELLVIPVRAGSAEYLAWVQESVAHHPE